MVELCFDKKKVNTEEELLDILQDNLIRVNDSIMLTHKGKRINIKLNQTIEADKQDSLWYGGTCATLKCKNFTFTLGARGDVECSLFDKDGNCLESVKDRRNGGGFYELSYYLHSDEDVRNAENTVLLNEFEKLFIESINLMDFELGKDEDGFLLIDHQGAYLGGLNKDRFKSAEDIIERLDVYWNDYYFKDLEEGFKEMKFSENYPATAEEWVKFAEKHKEFKENYKFELDVLEMWGHASEIDLRRCVDAEESKSPYSLEFRHNNWWECWIDTTDKKFNENYDDFWNVEESYFYRALADCIYVLCEHAVKKKGE